MKFKVFTVDPSSGQLIYNVIVVTALRIEQFCVDLALLDKVYVLNSRDGIWFPCTQFREVYQPL